MKTELANFLREECANDREYHCSTIAADWCVLLGHPDFAWKWRGVSDPVACEAIPAEAGGLVALWDQGIGGALPVVDGEPQAGDIAVIAAFGLEAGAVCVGDRWVMRAARGLHFIVRNHVLVIKAWRP